MSELPKTFDPSALESKWYRHWEETGAFRPSRPDAEPFTIVMPPPNVTGSLHIGHALDNTLQDVLIRHARLKGKDALWVVGTDHAGIATQMVVERQLNERQQKRTDFTREEFVAKVWDWKAESGGAITRQLRRLGASCDWANERFTMDEGFSKAVLKVFVDLYNQGLLYRDKRLVNWDPGLKTAISDLEVETTEINGKFWHFRYPLEDGSGHISVATTRPETMLADMAVAVNPNDERYAAIVGKKVRLPITGRLVPVVTDEHADPELGSGAVKITPGHDFNDFEVGKRAGFKPAEMLNMLDGEARICQTADGLVPEELLGMDRFDARKRVVELIEAAGLLERVEDRVIATPFGDRSGVVIEPWLTDQWYVDAETLAKPAIEAVRSGAIKVVPQSWEKTYFNWMENIQPWCVSRQLWWGHRIPAWFGPVYDPELGWQIVHDQGHAATPSPIFVAESFEEARSLAAKHYGCDENVIWEASSSWDALNYPDELREGYAKDTGPEFSISERHWERSRVPLWRDSDVLDTWFSSALWPFGTLGWPENSTELQRHYPNDVLISGFDILFFWDARMAMQGLHFMKEVPWKTLYLHGLVRAADGSKMYKSKGNTVDPLGLIDQYGADAMRFTLTAMESQGRDIKLDEKRVEGYRNFATKLWNAARFCQSNGIGASTSLAAPQAELAVNRWIIGEVVETLAKLDKAFEDLRYDAMADAIYHFTWGTFCDWYLELIKPVLSPLSLAGGAGGGSEADSPTPNPSRKREGDETRAVAGWVLDQIIVMLHPFMPFITEELWHAMGDRPYDLIHAKWPEPEAGENTEPKAEMDWLIDLISKIRAARSELDIPPSVKMELVVYSDELALRERLSRNADALMRLARLSRTTFSRSVGLITTDGGLGAEGPSITVVVDGVSFKLPLEGVIDLDAERTRIIKAIEAVSKEAASLAGRLNNPAFVEKAKPEAVEKARADHAEKAAEAERLQAALARLG